MRDDPEGVAESVTLCVSDRRRRICRSRIPPATRTSPLYPFDHALARIKAARAAIDKTGEDVMLTARTEGFIRGRPDMDETVAAPEGLRRGRRRLPLCAGHQDARGDRRRW